MVDGLVVEPRIGFTEGLADGRGIDKRRDPLASRHELVEPIVGHVRRQMIDARRRDLLEETLERLDHFSKHQAAKVAKLAVVNGGFTPPGSI